MNRITTLKSMRGPLIIHIFYNEVMDFKFYLHRLPGRYVLLHVVRHADVACMKCVMELSCRTYTGVDRVHVTHGCT